MNMFENCTALKQINIPNNIKTIDESSFKGCTSLESVTIPNSVTTIERSAFEGCTSLTAMTFNGTVEEWNAIEISRYTPFPTSLTVIHCSNGDVNI